jgi:CubicO group peptidase (beta-lactamase class C family)
MNRHRSLSVRIIALAISACWSMCAVAQQGVALPVGVANSVDRAIESQMRDDGTVGVALGIIQDDQIVYLKGYGTADRSRNTPVTTQTMFRWASISKPVTAIAALQLVEQGKLNLDADVRDYVPEFPDPGAKITCRQLLCHQGGIVHYTNGPVIRTTRRYRDPHPFRDVVVALDTFNRSPLVNPPGEQYSYSTHGYILASAVVQRAGGRPFHEQVSERICRPLGMESMQPDYQWESIPYRTNGYRKSGGRIIDSVDGDVSWKLGGGGYISTIEDLCRFAQGLMAGKLVSERTEAMMWAPQQTSGGTDTSYGLGFQVEHQGGQLKVSHGGSQPKTRTRMVFYPTQRHGVVVMTNSEWIDPGVYSTLAYTAMNEARSRVRR